MIDKLINSIFKLSEKKGNAVLCIFIEGDEVVTAINGTDRDIFNMLVETMTQYPETIEVMQKALQHMIEEKARLN